MYVRLLWLEIFPKNFYSSAQWIAALPASAFIFTKVISATNTTMRQMNFRGKYGTELSLNIWLCSLLLLPQQSLGYTAIGNCNRTEYNFCFVFCWYGTSRMTKYLRSLVSIPLVSSTLYCSLLTESLLKRAICLTNHSPMVSLHKLD